MATVAWKTVFLVGKIYLTSKAFVSTARTVVDVRMDNGSSAENSHEAPRKYEAPHKNRVEVRKAYLKKVEGPVQHPKASSVAASNDAELSPVVVQKEKPKQLTLKEQFGDCSDKTYIKNFIKLCEKLLLKFPEDKKFLNHCIASCKTGDGVKSKDNRIFIDGVEDKILALQNSLV